MMGLPLAAQFASHGWSVVAVDVNEAVVAALNEGRAHVTEEPDLAERVAEPRGHPRRPEQPARSRTFRSTYGSSGSVSRRVPGVGRHLPADPRQIVRRPVKIVSVVGTRPQLIKAAALLPELRVHHDVVLVDTGQHWDERMAGAFFAELGLPHPDYALGVGGGGHAAQTGRMLAALEPVLEAEEPDAVLVYGDTNSTLAGTLAAAKLGIPVAHVEAGLRSFDRRMPEEINRVVADHLATWCFAPTKTAVANLAHEGITAGVVEVGDLMQDLAARVAAEVRDPAVLAPAADALASRRRARPGGNSHAGRIHLRHDPPRREPRAGGAGSLARDPRGCRCDRNVPSSSRCIPARRPPSTPLASSFRPA